MVKTADPVKWFFATENYNDDFHTDVVLLRVALYPFLSLSHHEIFAVYEGTHSRFFIRKDESLAVSEELIERFFNDPHWRHQIVPEGLDH